MWGRPLLQRYADNVEFVGLCDINPKRAELAKQALGVSCPTFDNFEKMCDAVKPELLTVTTVDRFHADYIVKALDRGIDVITEKPMVTDEAQVRQVLEAEARNKRKIVVGFNYRFAPKHVKIKEILQSGEIGTVTGVDFHWYLDTTHGADYFRRWHRLRQNGSLWTHKATHHFDLINWWLAADPVEVQAYGELSHYGAKGPFHNTNCRPCPNKGECKFYWDITKGRGHAALHGGRIGRRLPARRLRVQERHRHLGHDVGLDPLLEQRADVVLAEHLHADRGLPPGLQRHQGPPRGARLRAPAVGSRRGQRHRADPQLRQAREDRRARRPTAATAAATRACRT